MYIEYHLSILGGFNPHLQKQAHLFYLTRYSDQPDWSKRQHRSAGQDYNIIMYVRGVWRRPVCFLIWTNGVIILSAYSNTQEICLYSIKKEYWMGMGGSGIEKTLPSMNTAQNIFPPITSRIFNITTLSPLSGLGDDSRGSTDDVAADKVSGGTRLHRPAHSGDSRHKQVSKTMGPDCE